MKRNDILGYFLSVALSLAFAFLLANWAACEQDDSVCLIVGSK